MINILNIFVSILVLFSFSTIYGQDVQVKEEKGKWGYVDKAGNWVIKPKYAEARGFKEGLAVVKKGKKWGAINREGGFAVKPQYAAMMDFSEGKAAVLSFKPLVGETKFDYLQRKWGYVDKSGNLVIPYSYRTVEEFKKNLALVSNWGQQEKERYMIDTSGRPVSVPFLRKEKYADSLLLLVNTRRDGDSVYKYIKLNGPDVTEWYVKKFEFKDFPVQVCLPGDDNDRVVGPFEGSVSSVFIAMLNEKGEIFTDWFNEVGEFVRGVAPVRLDHKWGFVDSAYDWVQKPLFRDIVFLKEGYYEGQLDARRSVLIDHRGTILSHEFENVKVFDSVFFIADFTLKNRRREDKYMALYDSLGNQRSGWYQNINPFKLGIARVKEIKNTLFMNDSVGMKGWYNYIVDSTGAVLCFWRPEVEISWSTKNRALNDSALSYLYAPNAKKTLTPEYFQEIFIKTFDYEEKNKKIVFRGGDFSEGMALVAKKVGVEKKEIGGVVFTKDIVRYGYIDWMGKQVIPYKFKEASNFSGGKAIIFDGEHYGAIDFNGRVLIKPQYQLMGCFGSGLAPVFKNGFWGYVNAKNKLVVDYQYEDVRPFHFGYAAVKKGRNWGMIDVYGKIVLDFDYRKAPKPISVGKIEVLKKGEGYTVIEL